MYARFSGEKPDAADDTPPCEAAPRISRAECENGAERSSLLVDS